MLTDVSFPNVGSVNSFLIALIEVTPRGAVVCTSVSIALSPETGSPLHLLHLLLCASGPCADYIYPPVTHVRLLAVPEAVVADDRVLCAFAAVIDLTGSASPSQINADLTVSDHSSNDASRRARSGRLAAM